MMQQKTETRVAELFCAVFGLPSGSAARTAQQGTTNGWDSMGHVTLVAALESEFGVQISLSDSIEITSFEAALGVVEELLS